jgi:hypothetical protein
VKWSEASAAISVKAAIAEIGVPGFLHHQVAGEPVGHLDDQSRDIVVAAILEQLHESRRTLYRTNTRNDVVVALPRSSPRRDSG